jgi:hypothetical protein
MLTTLRKLATGTALFPLFPNTPPLPHASLKKQIVCRTCGRTMRLVRFVNLNPRGVRGYYADSLGHVVALDRDTVTRCVRQDHERVYFA